MTKTTLVITALLLAVGSYADSDKNDAQPQNENVTITTTTVSKETIDWGMDREKNERARVGLSSTRLPGKTKVIKSTSQVSHMIELKPTETAPLCESDIDLEYYQKDTATEVRTLFTSQNCKEFDAKYQLRIMYFDADGEIQRIVAEEDWPVGQTEQVRKLFPMTPNSKLQRVSSRILSCTCGDSQ